MKFSMEVTIVFDNPHTPSDNPLQEFPYINISSPHPWGPIKVCYPKISWSLEEEVGRVKYITNVITSFA